MTLNRSIVIAFVVLGAVTFIVLNMYTLDWDLAFTRLLQSHGLGPLHFIEEFIFWMGLRSVTALLLIISCFAFWIRGYRVESILTLAVLIPDGMNILIKNVIARPRPDSDLVEVLMGYGSIQGFGFPSGHSLHLVLFYGFLLYICWVILKNGIPFRIILLSGLIYIAINGLLLVHDGRHWITDVLAGYLYGIFYLLIFIKIHRALKRQV